MSILTFLLFSSIVYFAIADPMANPSNDKDHVDQFIAAIDRAYDEHIAPILESLIQQDRDYFKDTVLEGIGGILNFVLYHSKSFKAGSKLPLDDEDIILQFDSADTFPSVPLKENPPLCHRE